MNAAQCGLKPQTSDSVRDTGKRVPGGPTARTVREEKAEQWWTDRKEAIAWRRSLFKPQNGVEMRRGNWVQIAIDDVLYCNAIRSTPCVCNECMQCKYARTMFNGRL